MAIEIVDGVRVPADDRLADLLWETDPAIFRFIFGSLSVWRGLFPQEWTADFSTQQDDEARVMMSGDVPVGLVNSFAGAEVGPRFVATLRRQLTALDGGGSARVIAAYDAMEWLFPRVPDDALYILNIVVADGMRGQDLGRRLIDEAMGKARRLGLRAVHLDTAADNPAVQFYTQVGFRAVVESRALDLPDGVDVPNHLRMVREVPAEV